MTSASPLAPLHRTLGAQLTARDGVEIPAHYGDLDGEYQALRTGCAWVDRSWSSGLKLEGPDRARFLNGLITCDVKGLEVGQSAYGFFTDPQGKVLSDVTVLVHEDRLWLEVEAWRSTFLIEHMQKYIVADRVEIATLTEVVPAVVAGPQAADLLREVGVDLGSDDEGNHRRVHLWDQDVCLARGRRWGVPVFTLWVPTTGAVEWWGELLNVGRGLGLTPVGRQATEIVRVEEGVAAYGVDFDANNFPQETGLEELAVSYTKGCYLGQEVVARIHYRGKVNHRLRGLVIETAIGAGVPLYSDEAEVGRATSVVSSLLLGDVGLAILHRKGAEPGTQLSSADGGRARVVELPFETPGAGVRS